MFDMELVEEILNQILTAAHRINRISIPWNLKHLKALLL